MRLHILAGCRSLLRPAILDPQTVANLIGPDIRCADAGWISPECGAEYHDFLREQPGDRRTSIMARALKDNFGERFEPLIVLPGLLEEIAAGEMPASAAAGDERRTRLAVLEQLLAAGHVEAVRLHGLALPSKSDPEAAWAVPAGIVPGIVRERIEMLRTLLAEAESQVTLETHVIECTRGECPAFDTLYDNALAWHFAKAFDARARGHGWEADRTQLASAIVAILIEWNERGIYAGVPMLQEHLDVTAERLFDALLQ